MEIVSVVIPSYNGAHYLGPCLESLGAQEVLEADKEIIVVDNGSSDGTAELLANRFSGVRLIANSENKGFTPAINQGLSAARGEWILLLNNDTVIQPGALNRLLLCLRNRPDVAGVQPLLVQALDPHVLDSAGIALGPRLRARDYLMGSPVTMAPSGVTEIWGACAACVLLRREAIDRCGVFDPDFYAELDDVDFAFRARWHGYRFLLVPDAVVFHHRSITTGRRTPQKFHRVVRNSLLVIMKNPPASVSMSLMLYRLQRDLFLIPHYIRKGRLGIVLTAWYEALRLVPVMLERRRATLSAARLSLAEMKGQLHHFMKYPTRS